MDDFYTRSCKVKTCFVQVFSWKTEMCGVPSYIQVSMEYIQTSWSQRGWPNIKQDTYESLTVTSFIFNVIILYSERQKRGSWERVLITSSTAHVTLMWGMNLSTRLHGITFKTTVTITFAAVKTSTAPNNTLMISGAEYEIMNLHTSVTHSQENIRGLKHKYCLFSTHSSQQTHIQDAPAQRSGQTYSIS